MNAGDSHGSVTDGERNSLCRATAAVTGGQNTGHARFQWARNISWSPVLPGGHITAGQYEPVRVFIDLDRKAVGSWLGTDEDEEPDARLPCWGVSFHLQGDGLEVFCSPN